MKIAKEEIEAIKQAHDLKAVIESYGVKLKKKGSNYVGLCPFHEEKTPSFTVNPKGNFGDVVAEVENELTTGKTFDTISPCHAKQG